MICDKHHGLLRSEETFSSFNAHTPFSFSPVLVALCILITCIFSSKCQAQPTNGTDSNTTIGYSDWITFSGNFEAYYDKTSFFPSNHNAIVGQWDTRLEFWLPPYYSHTDFTWGPYLRFSGIAASQNPAWENGLLSAPGAGFQVYPFSFPQFHDTNSILGEIFGPLRLYGEYDRMDYWGQENIWRPVENIRYGAEYWRAWHVNDLTSCWWAEFWSGAWWQEANEYDPHYNSTYFANSLRIGLRKPDYVDNSGIRSSFTPYAFTPYVVLESSLDSHPGSNWENYLQAGVGIRYTPNLFPGGRDGEYYHGLSRLVFFVEYVKTVTYYRASSPSDVPNYDIQAGISFSLGDGFWNR
jgi:hypothetical protein